MVSDDRTVNFWHKVEMLGEVSPSAGGQHPPSTRAVHAFLEVTDAEGKAPCDLHGWFPT